jgi:lipoprotein NlpI
MLRAAQVALQGQAAPPARKQALRKHYAAVHQSTRHTQIGRYLIGEVPEADVAKLVTDLPAACEVPYYFGARAQGEKRFGDAADWYRVAVECGLLNEAEYGFAYYELSRWRSRKDAFSRLR